MDDERTKTEQNGVGSSKVRAGSSITNELRKEARGFGRYVYTAPQADCLTAIANRIDAELAERYVELPLDADGEPIHVGERVQLIGNDPSTVSHMSLADDGWRVYVKYDGGIGTGSGEPKRIRHYHAPAVEDVLRDMLDSLDLDPTSHVDAGAVVAEYAAKLRLAKEGE